MLRQDVWNLCTCLVPCIVRKKVNIINTYSFHVRSDAATCRKMYQQQKMEQIIAGRDLYTDWEGDMWGIRSINKLVFVLECVLPKFMVSGRGESRHLVGNPSLIENIIQTLYKEHAFFCPLWLWSKNGRNTIEQKQNERMLAQAFYHDLKSQA